MMSPGQKTKPRLTRHLRTNSLVEFMSRKNVFIEREKKFFKAVKVLQPFWNLVKNRESELGALLYEDLFSKHDEYRSLFKGDNPHTSTQIMSMLTTLGDMASGNALPAVCFRLGGTLQYYGELHVARGVPDEAFHHLWQSFDAVFHRQFGNIYKKYRIPFKFVYDMCRNAMNGFDVDIEEQDLVPLEIEDFDPENADDTTRLLYGAQKGDAEAVKELLDRGVDVNYKEADVEFGQYKNGFTPLIWASHNGRANVVKVILDSNFVDANQADSGFKNSPLIWAAKQGFTDIARLLLNHKEPAAIDQVNKYNYTALMEAAEKGHPDIVDLLLNNDPPPNINVESEKGYTAIMRAVRRGHYNTLKQLCNNEPPPDLRVVNRYGRTVFDLVISEMWTKGDYPKAIFEYLKHDFFFVEPHFIPFEKLENIKMLRGGNFGLAYKAEMIVGWDMEGDSITVPVVCKVPKLNAGIDEWHEVQTLQNLPHHEHVISLLAMCTGFQRKVGGTKRTATIVIYKRGGSLAVHLGKRNCRLSLRRILEFGLDMARAVEHMHNNRYKHCDIAARNFLLSEIEQDSGRRLQSLALTDFGLTRPIEFFASVEDLVPARWSAPEVLLAGPQVLSQFSDVWMLGITFWELLHQRSSRRLPFHKVADCNLVYVLCRENLYLRFPNDCPREWKRVIQKCCTVQRSFRPSASMVVEEILRIQKSYSSAEPKEKKRPYSPQVSSDQVDYGDTSDVSTPDGHTYDEFKDYGYHIASPTDLEKPGAVSTAGQALICNDGDEETKHVYSNVSSSEIDPSNGIEIDDPYVRYLCLKRKYKHLRKAIPSDKSIRDSLVALAEGIKRLQVNVKHQRADARSSGVRQSLPNNWKILSFIFVFVAVLEIKKLFV